ncbi:MAG: acyl-CoA dehydrogenase family protein [Ilumatobacteraceae bacterium]
MDFELPEDLTSLLAELDTFIEDVVKPIENSDDNIRFFDHRREDARTDWERGGLPNEEWEQLLHRVKRLADEAGFYRYPFPKEYGGRDGTNLGMAVIREHFARKGLGCTTICRTNTRLSGTTSADPDAPVRDRRAEGGVGR